MPETRNMRGSSVLDCRIAAWYGFGCKATCVTRSMLLSQHSPRVVLALAPASFVAEEEAADPAYRMLL